LPITLTITADDDRHLRVQLLGLLGTTADAPSPPAAAPKARAQAAAPKAETPASDPSPAPSDTSPQTPSEATTTTADGGATSASPSDEPATDGALTYEGDIKPAVLRVSAKKGRPGVEALLKQFEVANAKEVPEARWPEFMAAIDKALEG
jgi:hypothetical protein